MVVISFSALMCNDFDSKKKSEYENGEVVNNLEHGLWRYEDETGKIYKKGEFENGVKVGEWSYSINRQIYKIRWGLFDDTSGLRFNYLNDWVPLKRDDYVFLAPISDNDREFFVVLEVEKSERVSSLEDYLLEVYQIMENDKSEIFTGYTINRVVLDSGKEMYSGELFTTIEEQNYVSFVLYTKKRDGDILDVTLKTKFDDVKLNKIIFNDIVYSLFDGDKKIFAIDDYVKSNDLLNLDSLFLN